MRRALYVMLPLLAWPLAARAQDDVAERLREALRRTTIDLRALQDNQATMQAQLDQANQQRDALRKQVDELTAKLGAQPPPEAPKPPAPAVDVGALQDQIRALREQGASLQTGLKRYQSAYEEAAATARTQDAARQAASRSLQDVQARLGTCKAANTKLIGVANDILHLYQTSGFRALVVSSYEPLLGLKRVELQNAVQDYEDRIRDNQFFDQGTAAGPAGQPATRR